VCVCVCVCALARARALYSVAFTLVFVGNTLDVEGCISFEDYFALTMTFLHCRNYPDYENDITLVISQFLYYVICAVSGLSSRD
jgi:hypothetical protein